MMESKEPKMRVTIFTNSTDYDEFTDEINLDLKDQMEQGYSVVDIKFTATLLNNTIEPMDGAVEYGALVIYKLVE